MGVHVCGCACVHVYVCVLVLRQDVEQDNE